MVVVLIYRDKHLALSLSPYHGHIVRHASAHFLRTDSGETATARAPGDLRSSADKGAARCDAGAGAGTSMCQASPFVSGFVTY